MGRGARLLLLQRMDCVPPRPERSEGSAAGWGGGCRRCLGGWRSGGAAAPARSGGGRRQRSPRSARVAAEHVALVKVRNDKPPMLPRFSLFVGIVVDIQDLLSDFQSR